jgi:hypothetical protein
MEGVHFILMAMMIILILAIIVSYDSKSQNNLNSNMNTCKQKKHRHVYEPYQNYRQIYEDAPNLKRKPIVEPAPKKIDWIVPPETAIELIKKDFLDPEYQFNAQSLPIMRSFPNRWDDDFMTDYENGVRKSVNSWNLIFSKYFKKNLNLIQYADMRPEFLKETLVDFLLKAYIKIKYQNNYINLEVMFFGNKLKPDDILDVPINQIGSEVRPPLTFQLVDIRISPVKQYVPNPVEDGDEEYGDFVLLRDDPQKYVDYIIQLHKTEQEK